MGLCENEVNDDCDCVYVIEAKNSLLCNRNPPRQQGRLTQLQSGCEKPR